MGTQVSLRGSDLVSFEHFPRSKIDESCHYSTFNFLRNHHTFCTAAVPVYSPTTRVPCSPHPHQHLSFFIFSVTTILTILRCYVIRVWVCIFLLISNVESLFMGLLAICMCFGENIPSVPLLSF